MGDGRGRGNCELPVVHSVVPGCGCHDCELPNAAPHFLNQRARSRGRGRRDRRYIGKGEPVGVCDRATSCGGVQMELQKTRRIPGVGAAVGPTSLERELNAPPSARTRCGRLMARRTPRGGSHESKQRVQERQIISKSPGFAPMMDMITGGGRHRRTSRAYIKRTSATHPGSPLADRSQLAVLTGLLQLRPVDGVPMQCSAAAANPAGAAGQPSSAAAAPEPTAAAPPPGNGPASRHSSAIRTYGTLPMVMFNARRGLSVGRGVGRWVGYWVGRWVGGGV